MQYSSVVFSTNEHACQVGEYLACSLVHRQWPTIVNLSRFLVTCPSGQTRYTFTESRAFNINPQQNRGLSNMKECRSFLLGTILLLPVVGVSAFYLPGAAPRNFEQGEQVDLFVNALTPMLSGKDDSKLVRWLDILCEVTLTRPYSTRNP